MDQLQELAAKWDSVTKNGYVKIQIRRGWTMIDLMDGNETKREIDHETLTGAISEALEWVQCL